MAEQTKKRRALVLLSGGLDSMLAVKILQAQGIEVAGVCFKSNFYGCGWAKEAAKKLGINLEIVDVREDMLKLIKNPPSGYGKNLNPCIDCHAMMIKKAGEYARLNGYDIVATGEILGQRPFSQNKEALGRVMKLSGVEVLRPLSAKLLPETEMEKQGLVARWHLFALSGRNREKQIELAERYAISDYPSPAGGCLLTDPGFSERLGKMLDFWPDCGIADVEILKHGRIFWLNSESGQKILLVIGRHEDDNKSLEEMAQKGDIVLQLKEIAGPVTVIRTINYKLLIISEHNRNIEINVPKRLKMSELKLNEPKKTKDVLEIAGLLTGYYAKKACGKKVNFEIDFKD